LRYVKTVEIITDIRFNHTSGNNEDVEFICDYDPCDYCGGTDACDCSICQRCFRDTMLECRCGSPYKEDLEDREGYPLKRRRLEDYLGSRPANTTEALFVDSTGRGWVTEKIEKRRRVFNDCCTMNLVKDITGIKQLYSSYGTLSNPKLLLTYGFLGPPSKRDKVSLEKELFHGPANFTVSLELRIFWKEFGYRFIIEVAKISDAEHRQDMEQLANDEECSIDHRDFVWWSLTIGECGWIPFPLKVWSLLCLQNPDQVDQFLKSSFQEKVEKVGGLLSATFQKNDNISPMFLEWTRLMVSALDKRISRYVYRPEEVEGVYNDFTGTQDTPFRRIDVLSSSRIC
jgi:hypothetical protein